MRADVPLERHQRPAVARRQDVPLNRGLEMITMGFSDSSSDCSQPRRIPAVLDRHGPRAYRLVINGEGAAIDLRAGVGRVLVRADRPQIDDTERLISRRKTARGASNSAAMRERLMHGCHSHDKARRIHT